MNLMERLGPDLILRKCAKSHMPVYKAALTLSTIFTASSLTLSKDVLKPMHKLQQHIMQKVTTIELCCFATYAYGETIFTFNLRSITLLYPHNLGLK